MHWIDIAAALSATRHCNAVAVTAAMDNLNFHHAIKLGNIVRLKASVNRAFNTSMEVGVKVELEEIETGNVLHSNSAYLTFVSISGQTQKPMKVPAVIPENDVEKRRYEQALKRREQRLSEKHGIIQH
jgi:acyl-CoA hydrolase